MNKGAIAEFHRRLHGWYGEHGRKDLPWRKTQDAYAIYVSEIMLQQTQVKTVLERYYFQFLERFPTLAHLAAASRDEVLSAWQGLGYYNRALHLHEAAKRCGGALPQTAGELHALPGVGRNTAHAVAAFAFREKVAVMEANVRRVLSRIFALSAPDEAQLWDKAQLLLDRAAPFDYNQAMMDIGALICTRRAPLCPQCPANSICRGQETPESYPAAKAKKAPPVRRKRIAVPRNAQGLYYAVPRSSRFLQGLYHFIETEGDSEHFLFRATPYPFAQARLLGHIRQQYSHFTLEAEVYLAEAPFPGGNAWYSLEQLALLPMSMAERKIMQFLQEPIIL